MLKAPSKNRFSPLCIIISQYKANLQNWIDFLKIQVHQKKFKYSLKFFSSTPKKVQVNSSTNAKSQVFSRFQVRSGNPVYIL